MLSFLLFDFSCWERRVNINKQLAIGTHPEDFRGRVTVSNLNYDDRSRSANATLELEVTGVHKDQEILAVSFSYQINPDGSKELLNCTKETKSCFTSYEEIQGPKGPGLSSAKIRLEQQLIRFDEEPSEIWYPFDKLSFHLDFDGTVNPDPAEAPPAANLLLEKLAIEDSEPNYILREDHNSYILKRKPFIRIVSFIFFVLSIVFLFGLIRISDAKDLLTKSLGFFGALWGLRSLLLPSTVKVFPTLIDYVILTEFCILFTIIISKVTLTKEAQSPP